MWLFVVFMILMLAWTFTPWFDVAVLRSLPADDVEVKDEWGNVIWPRFVNRELQALLVDNLPRDAKVLIVADNAPEIGATVKGLVREGVVVATNSQTRSMEKVREIQEWYGVVFDTIVLVVDDNYTMDWLVMGEFSGAIYCPKELLEPREIMDFRGHWALRHSEEGFRSRSKAHSVARHKVKRNVLGMRSL